MYLFIYTSNRNIAKCIVKIAVTQIYQQNPSNLRGFYVLLTVYPDINVQRQTNLMHNLFFVYFVKLYMFRPYLCPSSGGTTVSIQQIVLIIFFRWPSVVQINLYMVRSYLCPSSGGITVCIQQLVLLILFRWLLSKPTSTCFGRIYAHHQEV